MLWEKRGLEVQGFTNPLLALEYFKNNCNSIKLVLSDIRMPQINGYELVKKIRNLGINFKDAPLEIHGGKYQFRMPRSDRICKGVRKERAIK